MSTNNTPRESSIERTSRRKRGLPPEYTNELIKKDLKRQKYQKMSPEELANLKQFIADSNTEIKQSIVMTQKSLEGQIANLSDALNTEVNSLKSSVNEFQEKISAEVTTIKNHIAAHTDRLTNTENDIERMKYINDLRLTGFAQAEDLYGLFNAIAQHIGYDINNNANIPIMNRIPQRDKQTGTIGFSSTIIMHFPSTQHKKIFYSKYLAKIPLNPDQFGLPKENKIIIGENLTKSNAQIFKYAQKLKSEKKIAQVYTDDGLVKIKIVKGPNIRAQIIRGMTEIETIGQRQMMDICNNNNTNAQSVTSAGGRE